MSTFWAIVALFWKWAFFCFWALFNVSKEGSGTVDERSATFGNGNAVSLGPSLQVRVGSVRCGRIWGSLSPGNILIFVSFAVQHESCTSWSRPKFMNFAWYLRLELRSWFFSKWFRSILDTFDTTQGGTLSIWAAPEGTAGVLCRQWLQLGEHGIAAWQVLHHDQVKTLHSMWGKRWQEHLYICRRDHMRTTKMQSAISGIFSDPSTTIVFRASDCRKAQVGRCSKALKALPLVVRLDHTACRSSAGIASSWRGTLTVLS